MLESFAVEGERITLRHEGAAGPVVYLPVFEGDGADVWRCCLDLGCKNFSLAAFSVLSWEDDLTPWECPPIWKRGHGYHGRAPRQLELLEGCIMPEVERRLDASPSSSVLAGYSLGGLFASWSAFQTGTFSCVVSASGSMWFPGFVEYVAERATAPGVERAYFSLGDKEAHTRNKVLATVAEATAEVVASFRANGVETIFEWNSGNHFADEPLRTAKGIAWALRHGLAQTSDRGLDLPNEGLCREYGCGAKHHAQYDVACCHGGAPTT